MDNEWELVDNKTVESSCASVIKDEVDSKSRQAGRQDLRHS